jgi:adenylosuccinate synthase
VSITAAATRYVSLLGLGFGDCGKGLFTDHLCGAWQAHTVVRFNGGAQAGHNVVLADGRHHTFSQFGAGSFHAGVATVLASPVVVHPTALRVEEEALRRVGVTDAFARLLIDARSRVTTPFHQAAGRLREWARGAAAHGSCGVGVGETVRQALAAPGDALRYGDLMHRARALEKLEASRAAHAQ